MNFVFIKHAKNVLEERKISIEHIERVINYPELIIKDKENEELKHRLMKIPEYENRELRVIVKLTDPVLVITGYFDRTMRGKL